MNQINLFQANHAMRNAKDVASSRQNSHAIRSRDHRHDISSTSLNTSSISEDIRRRSESLWVSLEPKQTFSSPKTSLLSAGRESCIPFNANRRLKSICNTGALYFVWLVFNLLRNPCDIYDIDFPKCRVRQEQLNTSNIRFQTRSVIQSMHTWTYIEKLNWCQ